MINALLNNKQHYHTFELSSAFTYHPYLYDYKPYSSIGIRHFSTHLNKEITSKSVINSIIVKIKVGLVTPTVAEVFDLSLTLEPYASALYVYGDIENTLNINTIYIIGNTFRLNAYSVTCWVDDIASFQRDSMNWIREITFDLNVVKGHNFKGFKLKSFI